MSFDSIIDDGESGSECVGDLCGGGGRVISEGGVGRGDVDGGVNDNTVSVDSIVDDGGSGRSRGHEGVGDLCSCGGCVIGCGGGSVL